MKKTETVLSGSYLKVLARRDESAGASAAMLSGQWKIVKREGGEGDESFELFREWEDDLTEPPYATFRWRDHALLFASIAPISDLPPIYEAGEGESQVCLYYEGREVGKFRWAPDELVDPLNLVAHLVRNPSALALLLEAAGPSTMAAVGRLLYRRTVKYGDTADAV